MLKHHFNGYELSNSQKEAIIGIENFLKSNINCFILKGYGGTGKTFILKGLADFLKATDRNFVFMAPTGRAAKVIKESTGHEARTIHSYIYNLDYLKGENVEEDGKVKFLFGLKNNEDTYNTVYIIDESSMISDIYSEDEFFRFGSGFLLKDLIEYSGIKGGESKIIFVGDNAQLPPINSANSPALDKVYLKKKYLLNSNEVEMTDVVRQKSNSGILKNATKLRDSIRANYYSSLNVDETYEDILPCKTEDIVDKYISVYETDKEAIIIAQSNLAVYDYNTEIRKKMFPYNPHITKNDKVIVVHNNQRYEKYLYNGDFGVVVGAEREVESRTILVKEDKKEERVTLYFRNVFIDFKDLDDKPFIISCKILENILQSKERELSKFETRALFIDFMIRHPKIRPGSMEFKKALKEDIYFNALRIKYGYAITCHKAQGGEWENAFVDFSSNQNKLSEGYFRWAYTAVSRAKNTLFTVNSPKLNISCGLVSKDFIPEETITLNYKVNELVNKGLISKIDLIHQQYCEKYTFEVNGDKVDALFWYNGKGVVTKINIDNKVNQSVRELLLNMFHYNTKKIIIKEEYKLNKNEEQAVSFPMEKPFLKEFYNKVKNIFMENDIKLINVIHHNYLEKYDINKGGEKVILNIHYDGKGRFTKIYPQTESVLAKQVIELIKQCE